VLWKYFRNKIQKYKYNCKRWITRFAGRWRTQLAALSGVKCRTRRALDIRTHIAASGLSRGFVCLRVGMILKSLYKSVCRVYRSIKLCTRQTNVLPDSINTLTYRCCLRVIVQAVAITAEHYKFCWPLSFWTVFTRRAFNNVLVLDVKRWLTRLLSSDDSIFFHCRPQIKRDYPLNLSI
jgi:hypothetical protein